MKSAHWGWDVGQSVDPGHGLNPAKSLFLPVGEESVRAIHAALAAGVNFFDTAANYGAGHSERILGQALQGRRSEAVIATKFGHILDEERKTVFGDDERIIPNLRRDIENSLRRLGTEWIDLYQLHAGGLEPERALELRGMLEDLVQEGLIRSYGWSTDLVDRAAVFAPGENCSAIQFGLNAFFDNPAMRKLCDEHNLAGVNKDPLHRGVLTGKFSKAPTFPPDDIRSVRDYADEAMARRLEAVEALRSVLTSGGRTMAQGALAYIWALDQRMIPIPGFKTVAQVEQNAGALAFGPLSPEELFQVQSIVASFEI